MSWTEVETLRCIACRVFVPRAEIVYATDGAARCVACGPAAAAGSADSAAKRARELESDEDDLAPAPPLVPPEVRAQVRVVAAAVAMTTLLLMVAAWLSQT